MAKYEYKIKKLKLVSGEIRLIPIARVKTQVSWLNRWANTNEWKRIVVYQGLPVLLDMFTIPMETDVKLTKEDCVSHVKDHIDYIRSFRLNDVEEDVNEDVNELELSLS